MTEPTVTLPSGLTVPALGQGTWRMGEDARRYKDEVAVLRAGLDLGLILIDTAEIYGNGGAERVVGEAIAGRRDQVFLVSKVRPSNASTRGTIAACEASLKRLGTGRIDLYLLHWRGGLSLDETVETLEGLRQAGKIGAWGVSNFDMADSLELWGLPHGAAVATNQVLYNLTRRGIEYDLLPAWQRRNLSLMAYSPIEQGRLLRHPSLAAIAKAHGATPAQVALAWILTRPGVIAIPKAGSLAHVTENRGALCLNLTADDMMMLDSAFPPPTGPQPLEML